MIPEIKDSQSDIVTKLPYQDPHTVSSLSLSLKQILREVSPSREKILICVGTDRSTGDCLGPLVGTLLRRKLKEQNHLYGTIDEPVHAVNLNETLQRIQREYAAPYIIAVDACLGQASSVGCIQIGKGPLKPGAGVHKELPPVGDIHLTGIVNVGGFMEYFVLQNTRLSLVMNMAETMADALYLTLIGIRSWPA